MGRCFFISKIFPQKKISKTPPHLSRYCIFVAQITKILNIIHMKTHSPLRQSPHLFPLIQ